MSDAMRCGTVTISRSDSLGKCSLGLWISKAGVVQKSAGPQCYYALASVRSKLDNSLVSKRATNAEIVEWPRSGGSLT